jgi:type I restriction enzyme M protein
VAAGEALRERHPNLLHDRSSSDHFHHRMFHGFDFDNTMLRIGSMNMLLHGVESPDIRYRDSLAQDHAGEEEKYTLVLANPPFAGSLDYENTAKDLLQIVKTKKTELLFLALFLRLLKPGGRAAVIVPDGVLFGSSKAHKQLRRMLVEDRSSTPWSSCPAACSSRMRASPPRSCSSPRPTPAAPITSGSTTCRPTAGASTTSARRCCLRTSSVLSPPVIPAKAGIQCL